MIRTLIALMLLLPRLSVSLPQQAITVAGMKTGILLRMHVIAQDDTSEMQRIKLCVRDAVRDAYAAEAVRPAPMLTQATQLLPQLTQAAQCAARAEGFTGMVTVSIQQESFDERELDGLLIPAGSYPTLMIRLGDAKGHNWWGLIDPELALNCASWEESLSWDWSLDALWRALLMSLGVAEYA